MQLTLAMITQVAVLEQDRVADSRNLSISSLIVASFSMYESTEEISFRLIVVVVADKILHGVVREKRRNS